MNYENLFCENKICPRLLLLRGLAFIVLTALATVCACGNSAEKPFYLKHGDRVVFHGDSITDQRLYTVYAETFVSTRFPELDIAYTHFGWGGDRVSGGRGGDIDTRLTRDVFPCKPTVMTIMLGMNDGGGGASAFDRGRFDTFARGIENIVQKVRAACPGVRFTLIRPSPYDDVTRPVRTPGGYNTTLIRYGDFIKKFAAQEKETVADLNAPLVAVLEKANAANKELAQKIIPDRVHPAPAGHIIMAAALLKTWNAPAIVTSVEIDAAAKKTSGEVRTKVSDLSVAADGLTWRQLDQALPMPLEMDKPEFALAINCSDFMDTLNRQMLRVSGLAEGSYQLTIEGKDIGKFTHDELARGVNLAAFETPMMAQARRVHIATNQRTALHQMRWRSLQVPYSTGALSDEMRRDLPMILAALDAEAAAVANARRAYACPATCRYKLQYTGPVSK